MNRIGSTESPLQDFWDSIARYHARGITRVLGSGWSGRQAGKQPEWVNENPDEIDSYMAEQRRRETAAGAYWPIPAVSTPIPGVNPRRGLRARLAMLLRRLAYFCDHGRPWDLS